MSRVHSLLLAAAVASAALASGCTVTTVNAPVTVTTKPLPELAQPNLGKEVTGESCSQVVLLIIPVGFATAEAAYADALGKVPGADTLLRYEARQKVLYVFPFYLQVCSVVHGYAVDSRTLPTAAPR